MWPVARVLAGAGVVCGHMTAQTKTESWTVMSYVQSPQDHPQVQWSGRVESLQVLYEKDPQNSEEFLDSWL